MSLKIYQSTPYNHTHEREQFEDLCNICIDCFSKTEEKNLLFANINLNGAPIDALLVKPDAIIIIEFKDYGGSVIAAENGPWKLSDGTIVKGGASTNPFVQTQKNKYDVMHWFKDYFFTKNANLGHIAGIVVFKNNMEINDNGISRSVKSWFFITDMEHVGSKLKNITSPETEYTDEDLEELPQILNFDEYGNLLYPNLDDIVEDIDEVEVPNNSDIVLPSRTMTAFDGPGKEFNGGYYIGGWDHQNGLPNGEGTLTKTSIIYKGIWDQGIPAIDREFTVESVNIEDSFKYNGTLTKELKPNEGRLVRNFKDRKTKVQYQGLFDGWFLKEGEYLIDDKLYKCGSFEHNTLHNGKVILNLIKGRKYVNDDDLGDGCKYTGLIDIQTKLPEDENGELVDARGNRFVGPFENGKKNGRFKVYISGEQEPIQCDYKDDVEL